MVKATEHELAGSTRTVGGLAALQRRLVVSHTELLEELKVDIMQRDTPDLNRQASTKQRSLKDVDYFQKKVVILTEAVLLNC